MKTTFNIPKSQRDIILSNNESSYTKEIEAILDINPLNGIVGIEIFDVKKNLNMTPNFVTNENPKQSYDAETDMLYIKFLDKGNSTTQLESRLKLYFSKSDELYRIIIEEIYPGSDESIELNLET